jgi:hypothetical protein
MPGSSPYQRWKFLKKRQFANSELQQVDLNRKSFKTGQVVPQSGIYSVVHFEHRLPHEVTLLRAETFPPCSKCGVNVKFKLLRGVTVDSFKIVLNSLPEVTTIEDREDIEEAG